MTIEKFNFPISHVPSLLTKNFPRLALAPSLGAALHERVKAHADSRTVLRHADNGVLSGYPFDPQLSIALLAFVSSNPHGPSCHHV